MIYQGCEFEVALNRSQIKIDCTFERNREECRSNQKWGLFSPGLVWFSCSVFVFSVCQYPSPHSQAAERFTLTPPPSTPFFSRFFLSVPFGRAPSSHGSRGAYWGRVRQFAGKGLLSAPAGNTPKTLLSRETSTTHAFGNIRFFDWKAQVVG